MSDKRVAAPRPKVWKMTVKSTGPLAEEELRKLPSQMRSPLRVYLTSADNKGAKGWEELPPEARQPFVQTFYAARKRRAYVKTLFLQKAALSAYLVELDGRIAAALAPPEKTELVAESTVSEAAVAPADSALQEAKPVVEKRVRRNRRGGPGQQAIRRYKESLLAKLPEAERAALTQEEVVSSWKAMSPKEKRAFYAPPKAVSQ